MSIITKYDGKYQTFCAIIYKNDSLGKAVIYRTVICMMYLWKFISVEKTPTSFRW